jgi:hypothetical protein
MIRRTRLLLLSAAAFYGIFISRTAFTHEGAVGFTLFDDALISMRYARNVAAGEGLVWNVGLPPVEGYSNPLWTLWMAVVHAAGFNDLHAPLVIAVSGGILLILTAGVAMALARLIDDDPVAPVITFALVLFSYPLVFWTLRGLEVGLVALCLTAAVYLLVRMRDAHTRWLPRLVIVLVAAVLTRRDAAIVAVPLCLYAWTTLTPAIRLRATLVIAGSVVLTLIAQSAFSLWYFGDPLPNTYYLKMSGTPVLERLGRGMATAAIQFARTLALPTIAAAAAIHLTADREHRRALSLLAAVVAVQVAYSIHVGGDAWEYMGYANRYLAVALPALAVLVALGVTKLVGASDQVWRRAAALGLGLVAARALTEVVLHWTNRAVPRGHTFFARDPVLFTMVLLGVAAAALAVSVGVSRDQIRLRPAGRGAAAILATIVWLAADGPAVARWALHNADSVENDRRLAQAGLAIRDSSPAATIVAVTSAGAVPYFSRRLAVDILGKSDAVIARMVAVGPFHPGHDKWDLERSIARVRPDLVAGLPRADGQVQYLLAHDYTAWHGTFFARRGSQAATGALAARLSQVYPDVPPHPEAR